MKWVIVAIISDTAVKSGFRRTIHTKVDSAVKAVKLANSLYFLISGEREAPFKEYQLNKSIKRLSVSSPCYCYHVEIWQEGVLFEDIPGSSEQRKSFEEGVKP